MRRASLLQQRLGLGDITLRHRQTCGVKGVARSNPLVADVGLAVHRDLHDGFAVEREFERLAHARVATQRVRLCVIALAHVDRNALVADLSDARELEAMVGLEGGYIGRSDALDEIKLTRFKVRQPHGCVDDG